MVILKNVYLFRSKPKNKLLASQNKRYFSCDSKDVLYVLIYNNCDFFYIGQTEESTHAKTQIRCNSS